jgi:ABC-type glycerol-3-phosphate transport system substrate-binding protein
MRNRYRTAVLAACGALAVTQAVAGMAGAQRVASAEEVTISVSNLPPSTEAGAREAFLQRVEEFEAEYPHITIEPNEYEWAIDTFAAQLAGGTLPTVFQIPFSDFLVLMLRGLFSFI